MGKVSQVDEKTFKIDLGYVICGDVKKLHEKSQNGKILPDCIQMTDRHYTFTSDILDAHEGLKRYSEGHRIYRASAILTVNKVDVDVCELIKNEKKVVNEIDKLVNEKQIDKNHGAALREEAQYPRQVLLENLKSAFTQPSKVIGHSFRAGYVALQADAQEYMTASRRGLAVVLGDAIPSKLVENLPDTLDEFNSSVLLKRQAVASVLIVLSQNPLQPDEIKKLIRDAVVNKLSPESQAALKKLGSYYSR